MTGHESIWNAINDMREKFDARLRRVEYAVIGLILITASPKVGGPTANQTLTGLIGTLGAVGSMIVGGAIAAVGVIAAIRNHF